MSLARSVALLAAVALVGLAAAPASAATALPQQITWHGQQIHMYGAQSAGHDGKGVLVAVLDGWIDISHPDFQGRALAGADCRSGTCTAGLTKQDCGSQHGTHVAGTVGSTSYGVAPAATILPVQVLSSDSKGECTGTPAAVAAGIRYAIARGAKVLNLSLGPDVPGTSSNTAIPDAVHAAAQAGAVVVFSAGNADLPVAQSYGTDALIVAATGPSGQLAKYSQYGQGVSVAAPGGQPDANDNCTQADCVTSLYPGDQYAVAAGTSMAAPHVSGLAALLFGQNPKRARDTVIARIEDTAHALSGAGHGLIDVSAALGVTSSSTTSPKPSPAATHTTPPVHTASAIPSPTHATRSPSPKPAKTSAPSTSATATPAPVSSASPSPSAATVAAGPSRASSNVPVPLTLIAAALIGVAAAGVIKFRG